MPRHRHQRGARNLPRHLANTVPVKAEPAVKVGAVELGLRGHGLLVQHLLALADRFHQSVHDLFVTMGVHIKINFRVVLHEACNKGARRHVFEGDDLDVGVLVLDLGEKIVHTRFIKSSQKLKVELVCFITIT